MVNIQGSKTSGGQETKLYRHVIFCPREKDKIANQGDSAEIRVTQYIVDNLQTRDAGDYRILVNYHMPFKTPGANGTLEVDIVLINRSGIYLLEVKDWYGSIEAYDDRWVKDDRYTAGNPQISVENKVKVLKGHWFGGAGSLNDLEGVYVQSLVVLARGKGQFKNHSVQNDSNVVGIEPALIKALNPPAYLRKPGQRQLTDEEILRVTDTFYKRHTTGAILIEDYRVVKQLLPGDLFKAYEAFNQNLPRMRVRIKVYQLSNIAEASTTEKNQVRRNAEAVSTMGIHPNILYTLNFFPDTTRPDLYYEVTELIDGQRLDKLMADRNAPLPYSKQLDYIEQLCVALDHSHQNGVIHRNLSPETVFISRDGVVKLADFDFARVQGLHTIVSTRVSLVKTPFMAPEVAINPSNASPSSDLYSLGYLWFYLAAWPKRQPPFKIEDVETLDVPPQAHRLIRILLSSARESRPQSAQKLLSRLRDLPTA